MVVGESLTVGTNSKTAAVVLDASVVTDNSKNPVTTAAVSDIEDDKLVLEETDYIDTNDQTITAKNVTEAGTLEVSYESEDYHKTTYIIEGISIINNFAKSDFTATPSDKKIYLNPAGTVTQKSLGLTNKTSKNLNEKNVTWSLYEYDTETESRCGSQGQSGALQRQRCIPVGRGYIESERNRGGTRPCFESSSQL